LVKKIFYDILAQCLSLRIVLSGYGQVAPATQTGKLSCIAFSIVGIPLTVVKLESFSDINMYILKTHCLLSGTHQFFGSSTTGSNFFNTFKAVFFAKGKKVFLIQNPLIPFCLFKWNINNSFSSCSCWSILCYRNWMEFSGNWLSEANFSNYNYG